MEPIWQAENWSWPPMRLEPGGYEGPTTYESQLPDDPSGELGSRGEA
jgi:hypothetical protein